MVRIEIVVEAADETGARAAMDVAVEKARKLDEVVSGINGNYDGSSFRVSLVKDNVMYNEDTSSRRLIGEMIRGREDWD